MRHAPSGCLARSLTFTRPAPLLVALIGALGTLVFAVSDPVFAVTKNWNDSDGFWTGTAGTGSNWTPTGVPSTNDSVNIVFNDNVARTVSYDFASMPPVTLTGLTIDLTGGPMGSTTASTLSMPANTLSGGGLIVGNNGRGAFIQSGGTNNVTANYLDLGFFSASTGTYTLSNTGILSVAGNEYIGDAGTGNFMQSGGSNTISGAHDLFLGFAATGSGTYTLNSGTLSVGGNEYVGLTATGDANQSGGHDQSDWWSELHRCDKDALPRSQPRLNRPLHDQRLRQSHDRQRSCRQFRYGNADDSGSGLRVYH